MFSVFMLDATHGWIAIHRLPLDSAIHYARQYRELEETPVALVPDTEDPAPYLELAISIRVGPIVAFAWDS